MHKDLNLKLSHEIERSLTTMRMDQTKFEEVELQVKRLENTPS
jgi:hypothetical protein